MALPEPATRVRKQLPKCCRDPELKAWLDGIKALRDAGETTESIKNIAKLARADGRDIGPTTIRDHFRGECGAS